MEVAKITHSQALGGTVLYPHGKETASTETVSPHGHTTLCYRQRTPFSPHQEQVWQWAWPGIVQSTDWSRTKYTPSPKEGKLSLSKDICPAQAMWALYIFVRKWSGPKAHFPGTMQGWERRHACAWLYQEGVCGLRHEINRKESYSSHGIQPTSRLYILMNLYIQVSGGFFFFLNFSKVHTFMDLGSSMLFLITSPFLASLDNLIQWYSEEPQKLPLKLIDGSHFPHPREN